MLAFHGQQEIKDKYLARVALHRKADELVKGQYWKHGKGCAVGCTIHGNKMLWAGIKLSSVNRRRSVD